MKNVKMWHYDSQTILRMFAHMPNYSNSDIGRTNKSDVNSSIKLSIIDNSRINAKGGSVFGREYLISCRTASVRVDWMALQ